MSSVQPANPESPSLSVLASLPILASDYALLEQISHQANAPQARNVECSRDVEEYKGMEKDDLAIELDPSPVSVPIEYTHSAAEESSSHCVTYPYLPRCPTITDTLDESPRHRGQLVFKRLQRDLAPPSPMHYKMMIGVLLSVMFLSGWNDASQGPLLPTLQRHYHLDYLSVGFLWVCNFVGFLTAGLANVYITDRFGFGIAAPFAAAIQAVGYCLMTTGGPYPLFLSAFILNGFGMGFLDALVSGLTTRLPGATTKTFLNYAAYGFGATISPLVSTQFVKSNISAFLYYSVSLGLAVVNTSILLAVFQLRTADQIVGCNVRVAIPLEAPLTPAEELDKQLGAVETPRIGGMGNEAYAQHHQVVYTDPGTAAKMKKMFGSPLVHCLAFYSALYVGAEITIGGWAATFLQKERGGGVNVGYVSTGHFAGVTIGRLVLIPVANWLGKHNTVYLFTLISIALEVIIWTIPDLITSATCFSLLGFFLAPLYPILIMIVVDVLPADIHAGTIGWVASLGCAGSALMPFITAGVSNRYGIWILQPLLIATLGFSLILWAFVPRPRRLRA